MRLILPKGLIFWEEAELKSICVWYSPVRTAYLELSLVKVKQELDSRMFSDLLPKEEVLPPKS